MVQQTKHPVCCSPVGKKQLVDERSKKNGKNQEPCKQAGHIKGAVQQWCAERHLGNAQLVGPCHGWAIAAGDHTAFHTYHLKTQHAITNTGQLPSSTSPGSCCLMLMSWFLLRKLHESTPPSCLVSMVQAGGGGVIVRGMFSWCTLGPLLPIEQQFHSLKNSGCSGVKGGTRCVYLINWPLSATHITTAAATRLLLYCSVYTLPHILSQYTCKY